MRPPISKISKGQSVLIDQCWRRIHNNVRQTICADPFATGKFKSIKFKSEHGPPSLRRVVARVIYQIVDQLVEANSEELG